MQAKQFQKHLLQWHAQHGRKDLPWQHDISPYRVWISEIMLQQTQVTTVIPYYLRFMQQFATVEKLAQAEQDQVMHLWSGLGYYARARNLHQSAKIIAQQGTFPDTLDELMALPGIGRSTAGAILSIAFDNSHPILDGNVKRVLSRFQAIKGWPGQSQVQKQLWAISNCYTPKQHCATYTQAIMDLGATLCTRSTPKCNLCPLNSGCLAHQQQRVNEYPEKKVSTQKPVKSLVFLVLQNRENNILLHKRAATGVWGGLWSFPEFVSSDDAIHWCIAHNIEIDQQNIFPQQKHIFSHFQLRYTPLHVTMKTMHNQIMEDQNALWYDFENMQNLGLPAPVSGLIKKFQAITEDLT